MPENTAATADPAAPPLLPTGLTPLEKWLAPGILICIALTQMVAAHVGVLSPWKGGGFGMFSTVDGPGMRVLQGEGIDDQGQLVQLDVLGSLSGDQGDALQALPNLGDLGPMGDGLLYQEWVAVNAEEEYLNQLTRGSSAEKGTAEKLSPRDPAPSAGSGTGTDAPPPKRVAAPPAAGAPGEPLAEGMLPPLYRVRTPTDLPDIPTHTLRSVRLQWWRLRWDNAAERVYLEPLGYEVRVGERLFADDEPLPPAGEVPSPKDQVPN